MESKQQRAEKLKLLNEMSRVYTKLDKLVIENKMLKNEIKRLKKALKQ